MTAAAGDHPGSTRLVLVRHGEAQTAVDRLVGGPASCTGLSALGRRQAEALRDRLARTGELDGTDVLLASTMPRARETAEIIAPALGGLPVVEDPGLVEMHPGEADGMTLDDFMTAHGWRYAEADVELPIAPGGESLASFHQRVRAALQAVIAGHEGRMVVVACHSGVVDVALRALLDLPVAGSFELWTANTSLTELEYRPAGRWRLVRYNDAAHLGDMAVADGDVTVRDRPRPEG